MDFNHNLINWFKKHPISILWILIAGNLLLKGFFLSGNSLGGDEPFSVYHAQMDIEDIIRLLTKGNNPPLYEILLHGWIKIFGISEFSVRMPSLIFSCITLWFIYKIGLRWINQYAAVMASCIFICSNYHISFAHEARAYALMGMLCAMSVHYYLLLFFRNNEDQIPQKTYLILFVLVNTILIYTHYFGFFILMCEGLFLLLQPKFLKRGWKEVLIIVLSLTILYIPIMGVLWARFHKSAGQGTWIKPPRGVEDLYNMVWTFSNSPVVAVVAILFVTMMIVGMVSRQTNWKLNHGEKFIVFSFCSIFLLMFGVSFKIPMFIDRYLMVAAILYCLFLPMVAYRIFNRERIGLVISFLVTLLFVLTVKPNITNRRNVRELVETVKALQSEGTFVLICPHDFILNYAYYAEPSAFQNWNAQAIFKNMDDALRAEDVYGVNHISEVEIADVKRIIYVDAAASFTQPDNGILEELNRKFVLIQESTIPAIFKVSVFEIR